MLHVGTTCGMVYAAWHGTHTAACTSASRGISPVAHPVALKPVQRGTPRRLSGMSPGMCAAVGCRARPPTLGSRSALLSPDTYTSLLIHHCCVAEPASAFGPPPETLRTMRQQLRARNLRHRAESCPPSIGATAAAAGKRWCTHCRRVRVRKAYSGSRYRCDDRGRRCRAERAVVADEEAAAAQRDVSRAVRPVGQAAEAVGAALGGHSATALRAVTLRATVAWRMHAPVACVAWKPYGRADGARACYSARKPGCLRDPRAGAHLRRDLWTAPAVRAAERL